MANLEPQNRAFDVTYLDDFNANSIPALVNPWEEMTEGYLAALESDLYDKKMNQEGQTKIVYSAMHGVGAEYIEMAFKRAGFQMPISVKEQNGEHTAKSNLFCCLSLCFIF